MDDELRLTRQRIRLLSFFSRARSPQQVSSWSFAPQLGDGNFRGVIKKYVSEGLLRPPTPSEAENVLTVSVLRSMAVALGIRTGGSKGELLERVLSADQRPVVAYLEKQRLLVCSEKADFLIEASLQRTKHERSVALENVKKLLAEGEADRAYKIYLGFLTSWDPYEAHLLKPELLEQLRHILNASPASLSAQDEATLKRLRAQAALNTLWQEETIWEDEYENGDSLPYEEDYKPVEDGDERGISHILRNADYHLDLARELSLVDGDDIEIRFTFPRFLANPCKACRAVAGRYFALDALPEFPLEGCTSDEGCNFAIDYRFVEQDGPDPDPPDEQNEHDPEFATTAAIESGLRPGRTPTIATRLSRLKDLFDDDLITKEEYEQKKAGILAEL